MKSYRQWQYQRLVEHVVPLMNLQYGPVGNEAGERVLTSPFSKQVDNFKDKLTELPHPVDKSGKGLGDLGVDQVSKNTFKTVSAGEIPTLSQGIPVG